MCTIMGDLYKGEVAFIAGLDFTTGQPERYKNVYHREPELANICNMNKVHKNIRDLYDAK